uniref:Uncharacterized protein n=1 Tax=Anguilla anguilla TaxID=7936 RepID=A0A0E9WQ65_ANGAN
MTFSHVFSTISSYSKMTLCLVRRKHLNGLWLLDLIRPAWGVVERGRSTVRHG